jgi:hypothetical protein
MPKAKTQENKENAQTKPKEAENFKLEQGKEDDDSGDDDEEDDDEEEDETNQAAGTDQPVCFILFIYYIFIY